MKKRMTLFFFMALSLASCSTQNEKSIFSSPGTNGTIGHATPTLVTPQITSTQGGVPIVEREFIPTEWDQIYDEDMVSQVELGAEQGIWAYFAQKGIGYFYQGNWTHFSGEDYGLSTPSDMAVSPDGTLWAVGREGLAHYHNRKWDFFNLNNTSETAVPRLAISPLGEVYVALPNCNCYKGIQIFAGADWSLLPNPKKVMAEAEQILFTADGTLWASFGWPVGIGHYNGTGWEIYSGEMLWPSGSYTAIRIGSDEYGNVFAVHEHQDWLVIIDRDGNLERIPFYSSDLALDPGRLRLLVDQSGRLWINACLRNQKNACLAYEENGQWVSLTKLPFREVLDMKEEGQDAILIATENGLYRFSPKLTE